MRLRANYFSALFVAFMVIVTYAPIILVAALSFNDFPYFVVNIRGFTTKWYFDIAARTDLLDAIKISVTLGLCTAALATTFGAAMAYALVRRDFVFKKYITFSAAIPLLMPLLLLGIGIQLFMSLLGVGPGWWPLLAGHVLYTTPFTLLFMLTRILGLDPSLEAAARDLGANTVQTFAWVILPNIVWSLFGSFMLAFLLSFNELTLALFLAGPRQTLPLVIYAMMKVGIPPALLAFTTLMIVSTMLVAVGITATLAKIKR